MKKKLIPLALCLSLSLGLLAGCQSSKLRSRSEDALQETPPDAAETAAMVKDYTAAYESYAADEVMLIVNGREVSWGELYYWYDFEVTSLESSYGEIEDWSSPSLLEPEKTNAEFVMSRALDTVKHYRSLEAEAEKMGVALSRENQDELDALWQSNVDTYGAGDEAAFVEYLSKVFMTKELYQHISGLRYLLEQTMLELYGEHGDKIGAQEILDKAAEQNYVRAKHILISGMDDTGTALPEEKLTENKALAEKLIAELRGLTDVDALEARFDELIAEYGEDPGTAYYTEGYTFQVETSNFAQEFKDGTVALEDYGVSDPVETAHGYHIILRLPLKGDAAVELLSETEKVTLADLIAQELFGKVTEEWMERCEVEFTDGYEKLDLAAVLAKATKVAA